MDFETLPETTLRQGEIERMITLEDAKQIRKALYEALKHSDIGDREQLIALMQPLPAWINSDGKVMIAGWLLQLRQQKLVATYRLFQNAQRALGYIAFIVEDEQGWRIARIEPEKILFRR
ncbi:MAG: hypothetical protein SVR94_08350 [Pseudomonadota bacterium]|nr:hypothetical protein [Pseudomonadota bacterium]